MLHHFPDLIFILIQPFVASPLALEKPVIPLSRKNPIIVKSRQLKLMVHIGGDDKIIPVVHQLK